MATQDEAKRFSAPLMHAFRSAFEAHDADKQLALREGGERVLAGRRAQQRRGADETSLRRDLVFDLLSLLNTVDLGSSIDLTGLEHVRRSIINYGLYDVAHLTSEERAVEEIGEDLAAAIAFYEPRLREETLTVERDPQFDDVEQKIRFLVSADMYCAPLDVPVEFVADVDTSTGKVQLSKIAMLK